MRKTTPEEAVAIAEKYYSACILRGEEVRWLEITPEKLAALIDELRGVGAEPVATVIKKGSERQWTSERLGHLPDDIYSLYIHPAPSQPAAPVELPVFWSVNKFATRLKTAGWRDTGDAQWDNLAELLKEINAQAAIAAGRKAS